MAVFAYKVFGDAGRSSGGTLTADTPADGRRLLRERGWRIEAFAPALDTPRRQPIGIERWRRLGRQSRRADQVAEFARHLALLLRSGVPLAQAIDVLIAQYDRSAFQTVLRDLRDRVGAGASLAEAMQGHGAWFDAVSLSAVRVGQRSGSLDDALSQLAEFLRQRGTLRGRVTSALVYPMILLVLGIGVTLFLMSYVIPQLLTIITAGGKPLPASTAILKGCSDLIVDHWLLLGLAAITIPAGVTAALRTPRGRNTLHRAVLQLPLAGSLVRKALVARFAQQMAMLLRSGIPFTAAVATVRQGCRNAVLSAELALIERAVEAGSDIAPALAGSRVFPPLVVHLVAVGQDAGELPEMLAELRSGYEIEVNLALGKFTAALEPLLIVCMAGLIGFIIFATVMPILQVTDVMR